MKRVKSDSPMSASTENLRVKHDTPMKMRNYDHNIMHLFQYICLYCNLRQSNVKSLGQLQQNYSGEQS